MKKFCVAVIKREVSSSLVGTQQKFDNLIKNNLDKVLKRLKGENIK